MNITPQPQTLPVATAVNVQTDALRRENSLRETIAKPEATNQAAAEKGVASERERAKTPGQPQDGIDFEALQKQAEEKDTTINGEANKDHQQHGSQSRSQEPPADNSPESQNTDAQLEADNASKLAEQQQIKQLKDRDREVRAHEMAHAIVGGSVTGSPNYTFEVGADGKQYAVGGDVSVDLSTVSGDSSATIAKMQKIKAAALAPANPSSQDMKVAATASNVIVQEQAKLALEQDDNGPSDTPTDRLAERTQVLAGERGSAELEQTANLTAAASAFQKLEQTIDSVNVFSEKIDVDFDLLRQRTLESSGRVGYRPSEIDQRANRIESFYQEITTAYEKAPSYQFKLAI